ncbi:flagellar basal-body MS-ring/collar protein FliF [Bacillus sonorensis]|uniref:Flagellar M-ring protein n=2 Tax=Bacillus sonorensis TaxID=119858 RepID=M5P2L1_9BACI|nr:MULTISPECIES: flagellar basal-body MS-ring/collar protein FliF [Bacillus]TWK71973.1 Flagellar M-ring protein [Bacillus paralicheniformis]ASB89618.1 Flagellar M-ring protein [Bacillus sonorensis]EME74296.1 flagellar MS-ring protein [Bacillus sonorensis L12]MBG9917113.1 flagellar M-ring protein FliF [Bacillus sonorensis]MCF7618874.1 flagellar M-ring protein FliF [Bacillus sonorensis]
MNRTLLQIKTKITDFWNNRSKLQKILMIGGFAAAIILTIIIAIFASSEKMVPLYKDLSAEEAGQIKKVLDEKGVPTELADNGTVIKVPEEKVDSLKVDLAAEGLPKSGSIDYSFFSQNASFGMTDNEFDVLKAEATQTELSNLIKGMEGIKDAKVMINLPKESVFIGEEKPEASASIVLQIKPGYTPDKSQITGLYHLVSKSVPNLDPKNIVIMDQNSNYYDQNSGNSGNSSGDTYASQREIKTQIEKDLQRQVQSLLGTMMGQDKVAVSVTTDIDFTQEKRKEDLVEPVDKENMAGIVVSSEKISETYAGDGAQAGGVNGTGDQDVTNYAETEDGNQNGNYEKSEDRLNYEVNRIHKEIAESPYKVRDLGIQVLVEPPDPKNPTSLTQERQDDIKNILSTIVRTSIDKSENQNLSDEDLQNKIVVSVEKFDGKATFDTEKETGGIPLWAYIAGGVLLVALIGFIFWLVRRRKNDDEEYEEEWYEMPQEPVRVADVNDEKETEESVRRKQLEKMAKDKPEEFAKLLRSWLTED